MIIKVDICSPCNAWMNDNIENPARDLLKQMMTLARTLTELTPDEQVIIATWVAKTLMMCGLAAADPVGGNFRPEETHVHELRQTCLPPETMTVWVGAVARYVVEEPRPQHVAPKPKLRHSIMIPNGWDAVSNLYRLEMLVVDLTVASNWPVRLPVELNSCFTRIWPPHEDVIDWPPPIVIDRPTHQALGSVVGKLGLPPPFHMKKTN